jgi:plastocyanin
MRGLKIFGVVAILAVAGIACSSSDNGGAINTPPPSSSSAAAAACPTPVGTTVKVDANASLKFAPQNITVKPCQQIIWTVVGSVPHTVTSQSGATFDSGTLNEGQTYTQSFATAGVIHYFCKIHGASVMSGTITVSS